MGVAVDKILQRGILSLVRMGFREGNAVAYSLQNLPGFHPGLLPAVPHCAGGCPMSEVEPVSTSAMYLDQIVRLEAENARLVAQAARQSRQITEQSFYIGQLTRRISQLEARSKPVATQPLRNNGRRYTRLGEV